MTSATECKLANEAEIAHCIVGLVTDYDSWSDDHDHVDVAMVMNTMKKNAVNAQQVIREVVARVSAAPFVSAAHSNLKSAIMTHKEDIPQHTRCALEPIIGRYMQ